MPVPRAVPVVLTASVRARLKQRVRGRKTPYRDRQRALIVLWAARGWPNARVARQLGVSQDMVRTWRGRFAQRGLDGLADLPRSGRPRRISALDRAQVCALACQLPAETGVPLARWSAPELATELVSRGLTGLLSASSVRRILAEHPIKPWRYQSFTRYNTLQLEPHRSRPRTPPHPHPTINAHNPHPPRSTGGRLTHPRRTSGADHLAVRLVKLMPRVITS
jgi:transposase